MSKEVDPGRLDRHLIREVLAGYAVAAEVIEQERVERLRRITPEKSRQDYAGLLAFHERWLRGLGASEREGLIRLEQWRLETKIGLRRAFEKVALSEGKL